MEVRTAVEREMERQISDDEYEAALEAAKRKQELVSDPAHSYVRDPGYLVLLVCDFIRQNALSDFTMEVCRTLNMEKEHSFRRTERPMDTPIVAVSAE